MLTELTIPTGANPMVDRSQYDTQADFLSPSKAPGTVKSEEDRVLLATVNLVRQLLNVERCSLMTLDAEAGLLRMKSATGMTAEEAQRVQARVGEGVAGRVAQTGQPIFVADVRHSEFFNAERSSHYSDHSFICMPVTRHGELIGVINVTNRQGGGSLTEADFEHLRALSGFVSLALENVSLLETTQQLEEVLRDLLDSLAVAVVAVNSQRKITCWNRGAELLTRIRAQDAMGRDLLLVAPPAVAPALQDALRTPAGEEDKASVAEIEWPRGRGRTALLGVTRTRLLRSDGAHGGYVIILEDLSLRREILELKRVDEMKSNFMAMVSHELRTPLTSMRGSIRLLRDQARFEPGTIPHQLMDILHKNTERLVQQVDNLIEVTQIQDKTVTLNRERLDFAALVDECVGEFAERTAQKRQRVVVEHAVHPLDLAIDGRKMRKVLWQLLDNAVKFSREEGEIIIRSRVENGEAMLSLKDSGPGIDPEDCKRIFERFIQLEPTFTRVAGGSGLGLYIARELTRLHGGSLGIGQTGETGSEFVLRLPLPAPEAKA